MNFNLNLAMLEITCLQTKRRNTVLEIMKRINIFTYSIYDVFSSFRDLVLCISSRRTFVHKFIWLIFLAFNENRKQAI